MNSRLLSGRKREDAGEIAFKPQIGAEEYGRKELLGAQNRQRPEEAAQVLAGQGQGHLQNIWMAETRDKADPTRRLKYTSSTFDNSSKRSDAAGSISLSRISQSQAFPVRTSIIRDTR